MNNNKTRQELSNEDMQRLLSTKALASSMVIANSNNKGRSL